MGGSSSDPCRGRWTEQTWRVLVAAGYRWTADLEPVAQLGRPDARKVVSASTRSGEQAINRGPEAVQQGLSHTNGEVAAVVTDSTGRCVWAAVADQELYDAAEVTLPDHLTVMPEEQVFSAG